MSKLKIKVGKTAEYTTAASPEAAGMMSLCCASEAEIRNEAPVAYFVFLASRINSLPRLSKVETMDDVKQLLGDCVFWIMLIQAIHLQVGRKGFVSKWVDSNHWNKCGQGVLLDSWSPIFLDIQDKHADLMNAVSRFIVSSVSAREKILTHSVYPAMQRLLFDKFGSGDLYSACAMYGLTLRQVFEHTCSTRYELAVKTSKDLQLDVSLELSEQ